MIVINLRLFGIFRKYSEQASISLEVPAPCEVVLLKELIARHLKEIRPDLEENKLVAYSAIANEREMLRNQDEIHDSCSLAILPPVSGG